eukprot:snap_masked-scaffold_30-processed-gene-0.35-mRNA-1 protein AED:1.00 eAED:1.00 QI:0/0/0/0/1/1/2/0/65
MVKLQLKVNNIIALTSMCNNLLHKKDFIKPARKFQFNDMNNLFAVEKTQLVQEFHNKVSLLIESL